MSNYTWRMESCLHGKEMSGKWLFSKQYLSLCSWWKHETGGSLHRTNISSRQIYNNWSKTFCFLFYKVCVIINLLLIFNIIELRYMSIEYLKQVYHDIHVTKFWTTGYFLYKRSTSTTANHSVNPKGRDREIRSRHPLKTRRYVPSPSARQ